MKVDEPVEQLLRRAVRGTRPPALPAWEHVASRTAVPRRRRRGVLALAAAGLAAALLLTVGGIDRSGRPSTVERARAALAQPWPADRILHVRTTTVFHYDQPDVVLDEWQLTSAPFSRRVVTEVAGERQELATSGDGRGQAFDVRSGQVAETAALPASWRPAAVDETSREQMEGYLAQVGARALGSSRVDGHDVLGFEAFGHDRFYLDAETFLPVLWQSYGLGTGAQRRGYDVHYTWQLLDDTEANRALLDVAAQHPGAPTGAVAASGWQELVNALTPSRMPELPGG
jgi:hypothetical protein